MAEKELVFKVKVVDESGAIVEKTATTFSELNKSVSDLKKELENTDLGSEQFKELQKELANSEKALSDAKQSTQSLGETFTQIPGPIGQVAQGVKGLGTAFKALIANPVGLVIAAIALALTTLYKAFTSTKAGAEQMEQVMAGLGAVLDVLRDRVLKIGGAIVKFFSGDFKGAAEDAKGAFSGIGEEIASEFSQAMKLKAELQSIEDATRELNKTRAAQNALIAESKLRINDETLSYEERLGALNETREAEIKLAKQEEELAKRRYEAIKAQNALSDSSKEALDQEAQAYIALQQAQQQSLQKQKELFDQEKALRDRQRAERKAAAEERRRQVEEAQKFEQQVMLASIEDETQRVIKTLELQEREQLKTLEGLRLTAEKKKELEIEIRQQTIDKIAEIEEKKRQDDQKKREEEIQKEKEAAQRRYDAAITQLDAQIELEVRKGEEGLEKFEQLLEQRLIAELANTKLTAEERELLILQYEDRILAARKGYAEKNAQIAEAEVQAYANAAGQLTEIFGAETAAGKAAGIAQAYINTYAGVTKALNDETIPNTFLRIVAAGAILANGLSQVNKLMGVSTNVPKYAEGGFVSGGGTSLSDSIPAMLSNGEFVMNASSTAAFRPMLEVMNNQGTSAVSTPTQMPAIRAYVVASEVDTISQLDRQIKTRSML